MITLDFETYSEAGYKWFYHDKKQMYQVAGASESKGGKNGIELVGTAAYAEHPTAEVLCLSYRFPRDSMTYLWDPTYPPPHRLFKAIAEGELIEAHASGFEFLVWHYVCHLRMGWLALPLHQMRCSASKARAWNLPGSLDGAAKALRVTNQKDAEGKTLIQRLCVPKSPVKADPHNYRRFTPITQPDSYHKIYAYCRTDVDTEHDVSAACPELSAFELDVWMMDQRINMRGVAVDMESVNKAIVLIEAAYVKYEAKFVRITNGAVESSSKLDQLKKWMAQNGYLMPSITVDTIPIALASPDIPDICHAALTIRDKLGSGNVKKLYSLRHYVNTDGRVRGLFMYALTHTRRWAGKGPQPQNFTSTGPKCVRCECGAIMGAASIWPCRTCQRPPGSTNAVPWGIEGINELFKTIATGDLTALETSWGDPLTAICGSLRGMFVAGPGKELICSDFSAIEAVILATLAGEEWRLEVFRTHGKIYEASASKITGRTMEEYAAYKLQHGDHHPDRKLGKFAELASGYGGGLGAWKNFGADEYLTDAQIEEAKDAWRAASPNIVKLWYALERAAHAAVAQPGTVHRVGLISYQVRDDVLYALKPSGEEMAYHSPELRPVMKWGKQQIELTYMWASAKHGWVRESTYGGKLTENIVQSIARDLMANSMLLLDRAGYQIVLHVHDEIVAEQPLGTGDIARFERIMSTMPAWAAGWLIEAVGGWIGHRYRKE
jgi:DNA polymerase